MKKILAVNLGRKTAWCMSETKNSGIINYLNVLDFFEKITKVIEEEKPKLIITGSPIRNHNSFTLYYLLFGILKLIAAQKAIFIKEYKKDKCKKTIFKNEKIPKYLIARHYQEKDPHIAEAMLLIDYYWREPEGLWWLFLSTDFLKKTNY